MPLEPEFQHIKVDAPDTEWIKQNSIIPDQVAIWPTSLFYEALDDDDNVTDMAMHNHVLFVAGKAYQDAMTGEMGMHKLALMIPIGVARELATQILKMHGGAGGGQ